MRIKVRGFEFGYEAAGGETDPVVLIHGFPLDRSIWSQQSGGLSDVGRVIAPDLRGFGESSMPPGETSMDAYAEDVRGLLDALKITSAVIGGVSMGGYVALALIHHFPDRVRGLILVDTRAGADSPEAKKGRDEMAALARSKGASAVADRMLPKLLGPEAGKGLRNSLRTLIAAQSADGIVGALAAVRDRRDSTSLLPKIAVPTLIVCGEQDELIPPAESKALHAAIKGSRMAMIPGAGHLPNYEQPAVFNDVVRGFLKTL